jgi:hypothetical protein
MSTWATLLADIRTDLKDAGLSTPKWDNNSLYLYAKDAIRDYSVHFPKRVDRLELVLTNGAYPLPSDFIQDVYVECPAGVFLERRQDRPGVRFSNAARPTVYYIDSGQLKLNSTTTEEVLLTYDALHPVPTSADDSAFALTIPLVDEELIRLYVKAKATEQIRTQQANLDRFKLGTGKRDDNPLEPEMEDLMGLYRYKIAERTSGGVILLFRPGRRR